ncbi:MAG: acylase [Anaerolineae bacterium]|jgi:penicillin amidase/acyl-homoserine-lactone acylase
MRKRIPWKRIAALTLLALLAFAAYVFWPQTVNLDHLAGAGAAYDARILRDTWGVPHVFGKTDADVAYGLAYAHAEDDFLTIQQSLIAARGQLASVYGKDAAPNDYMVHLLRVWDVVEAGYETLSPQVQALCEAYAAGLNHYAALHSDEALPRVFPVTGQDVVAGSVHKSPLFFGLDGALGELFESERKKDVSARKTLEVWETSKVYLPMSAARGSNTFSVSPLRSSDGQTFLAVNSHQPWEGPVTWYEAHLHSEEGWDTAGALFPGVPVIVHGHNRDLGWAFTVNSADLIDIYVLDINPENENQYRFDGQWLDLEVRTAPIRVKLIGRLSWTFKEKVLWSVYGPVVRRPHGTYAVRYAGYGEVGIYEQLYRLNKAQNLAQWQDAMRAESGLPTFNVGYADREGNIYYLYNALLPLRVEGYDWEQYLPGDTSETLWTEYLPFEQLPQVKNPASGFVQNCNSSPFQTTLGPENPRAEDYAPTFGIETHMNNRALRIRELFGADESITAEEFYAYKYDMAYSPESIMADYVRLILDAPLPDDAEIQAALEIMRNWEMQANPENTGTALAVWTFQALDFPDPEDAVPSEVAESFVETVHTLQEAHGRVDVPWSEVNRLQRGELDLGLGGGPDLLHAVYGKMLDDGRLQGQQGDSYVMLVTWDREGRVSSRSIHQYGSATLDENSPHYADQAPLFVQRQLKPVWLDEADIRANLEREYRPGE